jgi:sugar lactone lactonase YvrE
MPSQGPEGIPSAPWSCSVVVAPTGLHGANGMQFGPGGLLYIASSFANKVNILNPRTGAIAAAPEGPRATRGPDDVAFSASGDMFITEPLASRVSVKHANGPVETVSDSLPAANGLAVYHDRLFISECRLDGRVLEQPIEGGEPRVLAERLPFPNAMAFGPDGMLYFPVAGQRAVWRVNPDGDPRPEEFLADAGRPSSVKFDWNGDLIYTDSLSGHVVRASVRTRERSNVAELSPGLDNTALIGHHIYVSNFLHSSIHRVSEHGAQALVKNGLVGPYGMAVLPSGEVAIADGLALALVRGGEVVHAANWHTRKYPGFLRSIVARPAGGIFAATSAGSVVEVDWNAGQTRVIASGLNEVMGMVLHPDGTLIVAETGAGRVLAVQPRTTAVEVVAAELLRPTDVAVLPNGRVACCESARGTVTELGSGATLARAAEPHSIAAMPDGLAITDAASRRLLFKPYGSADVQVIASSLPIRSVAAAEEIPGNEVVPGPLPGFADLELHADGSLLLGGNADGSVLKFQRPEPSR